MLLQCWQRNSALCHPYREKIALMKVKCESFLHGECVVSDFPLISQWLNQDCCTHDTVIFQCCLTLLLFVPAVFRGFSGQPDLGEQELLLWTTEGVRKNRPGDKQTAVTRRRWMSCVTKSAISSLRHRKIGYLRLSLIVWCAQLWRIWAALFTIGFWSILFVTLTKFAPNNTTIITANAQYFCGSCHHLPDHLLLERLLPEQHLPEQHLPEQHLPERETLKST